MSKICTDINQSKKLIELGIDVNTADMRWEAADVDFNREIPIQYEEIPKVGFLKSYLPAWSFSTLVEMIPVKIKFEGDILCLRMDKDEKDFNIWYDYEGGYREELFDVTCDNPIDAVFELIVLLKENKKI